MERRCLFVGLIVPLALASLSLAAPASAGPAAQGLTCTVSVDKTAWPAQIILGETVTVTLKVDGSCPQKEQPADVVLTIDRSESMTGEKLTAAKNAAVTFVQKLDPSLVRIAVVAVAPTAVVVQSLTNDQAALIAAIQGLTNQRGTNLVDGLDVSRAELVGSGARPGVRKIIVFMTDGKHTVSNPPIANLDGVIAAVRDAGIEVFAIGLGGDADQATLRRIASDEAHYYYSPSTAELESIYVQIAGRTQAALLFSTARIMDILPGNMTFLPGTGKPIEPAFNGATRTLSWAHAGVVVPGYTLSYRIRPTQVGLWPTNESATLEYVDGFGNGGRLVFPIPKVRVIYSEPTIASCVCPIVLKQVPRVVINDALANPQRYYGWQYPLDPGKPPSPANPPRECLTLANVGMRYHPLWNKPVWRVGCP